MCIFLEANSVLKQSSYLRSRSSQSSGRKPGGLQTGYWELRKSELWEHRAMREPSKLHRATAQELKE